FWRFARSNGRVHLVSLQGRTQSPRQGSRLHFPNRPIHSQREPGPVAAGNRKYGASKEPAESTARRDWSWTANRGQVRRSDQGAPPFHVKRVSAPALWPCQKSRSLLALRS